jgi:hypothetical protein
MAATSLLADRLHSHPQFTVHTSSPYLTFSVNKEEFDVSLNLLCYRNGSDHYSHDLVIFPCGGIDIPWQLRERLTVSIAPAIAPPYRDVDDMVSRASQLSAVASIVTAGLEELFGLRSKTRLKSVAPISAQEVEALLKYHARTTP